ncbi:MAG: aldo/keto reductase [Desulfitobacteriaceae bacterium]
MQKKVLGGTGIEVTELCFGVLPMGPLQAKIPTEEGAEVILSALNQGVNFLDTAQAYLTYPYIKEALASFSGEVVIATKSAAESYEAMEQAIKEALAGLGREYIDIFHLHAAKVTPAVFEERAGALRCLQDYKTKGIVRAIGISTHVVEVVALAAEQKEIDIVFPIINKLGMGIVGGTVEEMIGAIGKAYKAGKGLYAMKALAGGHLINELKESFDFVRRIEGISSVAVGMIRPEELTVNLKLFRDEEVAPEFLPQKATIEKKLFVSRFCKGCGTCVEVCPNNALSLRDGQAVVNHDSCLLCGYCNPVCPEFALRLV